MSWAMVAAAAVAVVGSISSSNNANKRANKQASAQNTQQYNNYTNNIKTLMENNKAIEEANTTNMIRAGFKASIMNLQDAKLKEQAAVQGFDTSRKAAMVLSGNEANAAAAGTIGASVDAVVGDIQKKSQQAQIGIDRSLTDRLENQNIMLTQLTQAASDAQRSPQSVPDISSVNTIQPVQQSVMGNAFGAAIGSMASNGFSFGSGGGGGSSGFTMPDGSAGASMSSAGQIGGASGGSLYSGGLGGVGGSYGLF